MASASDSGWGCQKCHTMKTLASARCAYYFDILSPKKHTEGKQIHKTEKCRVTKLILFIISVDSKVQISRPRTKHEATSPARPHVNNSLRNTVAYACVCVECGSCELVRCGTSD